MPPVLQRRRTMRAHSGDANQLSCRASVAGRTCIELPVPFRPSRTSRRGSQPLVRTCARAVSSNTRAAQQERVKRVVEHAFDAPARNARWHVT
jgi:hypothetical protein